LETCFFQKQLHIKIFKVNIFFRLVQ